MSELRARMLPIGRPKPAPVRRYHFHAPGLIYIGVTLFLAVGAINSQNNLLFAALGLAIGGLLVSGVLSGSSLLGVRIERAPVRHAVVAEPLTIRYTVANENRLAPAFGLNIVDLPAVGTSTEGGGGTRGFVAHVAARRAVTTEAVFIPRRRGLCEFGPLRVWSTFPFGLARKSVTFDVPYSFVAKPVALKLRPGLVERFTSRSMVGTGSERTPGAGDDFFGLREYSPGDSPRRIAWRRTARTGDLVVRMHSAPSPLRLWVALRLDAPPGPAGNRTVAGERAIALAAAVLRHATSEGLAIGLAVASPRIVVPPAAGQRHLDRLLNELALIDLDVEPETPAPLPAQVGRASVVVVVSAGEAATASAPRTALHLTALELESYIAPESRAAAEVIGRSSLVADASIWRRALLRVLAIAGFSGGETP